MGADIWSNVLKTGWVDEIYQICEFLFVFSIFWAMWVVVQLILKYVKDVKKLKIGCTNNSWTMDQLCNLVFNTYYNINFVFIYYSLF